MLESIYNTLKETYTDRKAAMVGESGMPRYAPPPELQEENVQELITATHDSVADAAANNNPPEMIAASRKANLLLSMARDNQSAARPRLEQVRGYLIYLDRSLYESDPENTADSDGLLLSGVKRVDL